MYAWATGHGRPVVTENVTESALWWQTDRAGRDCRLAAATAAARPAEDWLLAEPVSG